MAVEQGSVTATASASTNATIAVTAPAITMAQGDVVSTAKSRITVQVTSVPLTIARGTITVTAQRKATVGVTSQAIAIAQGNEIVSTPSDLVVGDATNTGVPAGSVLVTSGAITTTANGQIIELKNANNTITINHNKANVRKCRYGRCRRHRHADGLRQFRGNYRRLRDRRLA
jgi:hypothetical protein